VKSLSGLSATVAGQVSPEGREIIVAVTGQKDLEGNQEGLANYFGSIVVMKYTGQNNRDAVTLAHELGHILGALHSADHESVMHFAPDTDESIRFDRQTSEIITLTREWMTASTWEQASLERELLSKYQDLSYGAFRAEAQEASSSLIERKGRSHADLGNVYQRAGNYRKAIDEYQKAIDIYKQAGQADDALAVLYFNLGVTYTQQADYHRAVEAYKSASRFNCSDPSCYKNLGIIYTRYLDDPVTGQEYIKKSMSM
jgi:tetratricopeptide (TPR) repeat protein